MPSMLAIVSKDVFEKARAPSGKTLEVGDVYGPSQYISMNPSLLANLDEDLFLVTVRGDRLWWVGTLRSPKHDGKAFRSTADTQSIVDITKGAAKLKFSNGKGIQMDKMAMSLQTPRVLSDGDVALFESWQGASTKAPVKAKAKPGAKTLPATTPQPAKSKKPAAKASPTKAKGAAHVVTGTSSSDLAGLKDTLGTRPASLDIVMTDPHAQLPAVMALLEQTGPHTATSMRLAHEGFDVVRTETVGRDAIKKPPRLDTMLPALERLVLEGHEMFTTLRHPGVTSLEMIGMSISRPWGKDSFPALRSLRWVYPTDIHGVATGLATVLPIFVGAPFPRLAELDLSKVDLDSEESLDTLPEITQSPVWKQLERVLLPGQSRPIAPSKQPAAKAAPAPKLPLRLEPGHALLSLDRNDLTRHRAHVLVGRETDASVGQLARYLKDARPAAIEHVHVEIDPDAFVKAGAVTQLMAGLADLPGLRRVSTRETTLGAAAISALARSTSLTQLELLAPLFSGDTPYAALEPLLGRLAHLRIELYSIGKPMSAGQLAAFVAQVRKSPTLRSLRFKAPVSTLKGAAAGTAWAKVAGGALEELELDVELGADGVKKLLEGLRAAPALRRLGFGWNSQIDDAALDLIASSKLALEALSIGAGLDEDDKGLAHILERMRSLRQLTLRDMESGGAAIPAALRANTTLEHLSMPTMTFEGRDALALAKAIGAHPCLRTAALDLNRVDTAQQKQIVAALARRLTTLLTTQPWLVLGLLRAGKPTSIDISGCSQDIEKNLAAIYAAAASCKTLERLAAANQQHSAAAKNALVSLIEKSPSLREIDVRFCGLGDRDVARVLKAVANRPQLEVLGLAEADPSKELRSALDAFAAATPRLRWL